MTLQETVPDERLITEVRAIDGALSRLSHLRGIFYEYADAARAEHGCFPPGQSVGVSAQAVEAVLPQAVRASTFDAGEDEAESGGAFLAVRHDLLVPLLIEAVHERGEIIDALARRVADLEYRVRQIR
jgi:hypothetical protein